MAFKTNLETPETEAARLAQSPVGSRNHDLSRMPVNIHHITDGMLIQAPLFTGEDASTHGFVVIPITAHPLTSVSEKPTPRRRHDRSWDCIVVASNHPKIPVGGYRVSLPEFQLVRGTLRTLDI